VARRSGPVTRALAWLGLAVALLPLGLLVGDGLARLLAGAWPAAGPDISPRVLGLLANSLLLALATALLATLLGTPLAVWLFATRSPVARLIGRAYLLPFFLPSYVLALAWLSIAGRRQLLDSLLASLLGPDRLVVSAYGFAPAALVLALALSPIVTLLVGSGIAAVDAELLEEALVFEAPGEVTRRVLLPLVAPGILSSAGIVFALALVDYGVPSALQQNVYAMEIYARFSQDADASRTAALALPLFVPAALALVVSQRYLRGAPLRGGARRVAAFTTAGWPIGASALTSLCVGASALATFGPVIILVLRLGSTEALTRAALAAGHETGLSLGVAAVVASLAALLAVPAARVAVSSGRATSWSLWALPLALPAPLVGVALAAAATASWFDWARDLPLALVLAHLARILPFAVLAAAAQVRRLDGALLDAAAPHDVGWWRRARRVEIPLLVPASATTWLVAFVLSLGEIGATLLVVPPGQTTLPLRVFNLMHYGATDAVAALALIVAAVAGAAALLVSGLRKVVWPWVA
jgi:iron(III) transport system permease protein